MSEMTELKSEPRLEFDAAAKSLGFTWLGDLVAKKQRDIVVRFCISPDRLSYAVLMAKRTMYLGQEFFSRFGDDYTLTTTTNMAVGSQPETGMYYKAYPGLPFEALWEKHLWGLGRFKERKGAQPTPLEAHLLGAAKELDCAFGRVKT